MDRRRLLQLAGACASGLWLPQTGWGQSRFSSNPFAIGVASGSPTHDSVVLWTRLVGAGRSSLLPGLGDVPVRWEVADDEGFQKIVRKGQVPAAAGFAHAVHAEVDGLAPDRWYYYRFMVADAVSAVGRTRTLPQPDALVSRFRLAYASCQKWEDGYYAAWRHMRLEQPDVVLFLGDYIYEYPGTSSRVRVPGGGWVVTLDDYRQRYALYKSDIDLQAMHQSCPWLMVWDDHEVQNDYAGVQAGASGARDPAAPEDFAARRAAAYQAYYEHMPLRASALTRALGGTPGLPALRMHERLQVGQLLSVHLLDDRQYRDPQVCTRGGQRGGGAVNPAQCPAWNDPRRSLLGAQQEAWLERSLARPETAQSGWNVIAQQTVFGKRDFKPGPGESLSNDGWDGYSAARGRLITALRKNKLPNTVMLGGDVHANWVGQLKADYEDPRSAAIGVEFCGTSITSRGGGNEHMAERLAENPHFLFADAQARGYGIAEFSQGQLATSLRAVQDVTQRYSAITTLAGFVVRSGVPVVERTA